METEFQLRKGGGEESMDTDITLAVVKVYGLIIANKAADSNTTSLVVMAVKGKKTESAR